MIKPVQSAHKSISLVPCSQADREKERAEEAKRGKSAVGCGSWGRGQCVGVSSGVACRCVLLRPTCLDHGGHQVGREAFRVFVAGRRVVLDGGQRGNGASCFVNPVVGFRAAVSGSSACYRGGR